jgi:hypothetical protein
VAFTVLVLSKAYSVAKSAVVPVVVGHQDELVDANAKLAITGVLAGFLVAGPGVLLLHFFDARWVLRVAALVFFVAGLSAIRLHAPEEPRPVDLEPDRPPSVEDAHPALHLAAAAAAMALLRAEVGFLTFLIAFAFRRGDAPSWWFGVVLAASMAASLAGSAVAPILRRGFSEERILVACLALVAAAGLGIARVDGRLWAAGVAAVVGLAASAGKLAFDALVQRDAPPAARGRVFARFEAGFQLVWVVGALLPVVVATPLRQGYDVIGGGALAAAIAYALALRRLHP